MAPHHGPDHKQVDEMDDLDAYIATFTPEEQQELTTAEVAIDIATLLYRARAHRGLTQEAAAKRAGIQQQAVSRLECPHGDVQLATLQKYLGALGYALEISVIDPLTGQAAAQVILPSGRPLVAR